MAPQRQVVRMDGEGKRPNVVLRRSYRFALAVIELSRELVAAREYVLARQVERAGTSIGANAEEAQAAQSRADFCTKMAIASKEARESNYWLRLIRDSKATRPERIQPLIEESLELVRLLTSIVKTGQEARHPNRRTPAA